MAKVSNETRLLVALVKERAKLVRVENMPISEEQKRSFRHGINCVLEMLEDTILELEQR